MLRKTEALRLNPRLGLWIAVVCVLGGTIRALGFLESHINAANASSQEFRRRIDDDATIISKRAALQRAEEAALAELLPFRVSNPASTVERFVRDLEADASKRHVDVLSLTASPEAPAEARKVTRDLVPTKLSMSVRGRFSDIVRFVQDLSRGRSLAELSMPKISASPHTPGRLIEATLGVTLYRLGRAPA